MLLMSGGADTIAPPAANQLPVFQDTSVPTFWGTLAGADHVTFALGGEPCHDLSVVLRGAFPGKRIVCTGYGDDVAYIPSDRLIGEGGYEADGSLVEYRLKGRIAPGVDARLVRDFAAAVREVDGA